METRSPGLNFKRTAVRKTITLSMVRETGCPSGRAVYEFVQGRWKQRSQLPVMRPSSSTIRARFFAGLGQAEQILFVSQGNEWVHARGSARGKPACNDSRGQQQRWYAHQRPRIVGRHSPELSGNHFSEREAHD